MADAPRPLTRQQLAAFLKDHVAIRTMERMSQVSLVDTPAMVVDLTAALEDAAVLSSTVDARLSEATAATNRLAEAIEQLLLQPALREPAQADDPLPVSACRCAEYEDVAPRGQAAASADDLTPVARAVVIEDDLRPPPVPLTAGMLLATLRASLGVATLAAGTVTVNTPRVTANSRIFLTVQSLGTVVVATPVAVTARVAGTSFTITSSNVADTSVIAWLIIEPA